MSLKEMTLAQLTEEANTIASEMSINEHKNSPAMEYMRSIVRELVNRVI